MKKRGITLAAAGFVLAMSTTAMIAPVANAAAPAAKEVRLGELFARYVKAGYSALGLPEFGDDKRVRFTAVVVEQSQGITGGSLMLAGDPAQPDEDIARLTGFDEAEDRKMRALPVGAKFDAVCSIEFTSGTEYLSMGDCVVKR